MLVTQYITKQLSDISPKSIENTIALLNDDCTVPFIARYRKEVTGNLDEVQISSIVKWKKQFEEIEKRKKTILKAIEEQGELTDEIREKIDRTFDLTALEDIYLPFKKKRKTKASAAKEKGLEPLAKIIASQKATDIESIALKYTNNEVASVEEALEGARHIIAEWMSENTAVRNNLRREYKKSSFLETKKVKNIENEEEAQKFKDYFDWSEPIQKCPSHRLLAILRAESKGFIKLKNEIDREEGVDLILDKFSRSNHVDKQVYLAAEDSYKRLLAPSISNETVTSAKEKADDTAIKVFAKNLKQLLLGAPLGEKNILAIDPGYRTGCKVVCLNKQGDLVHNETIFPHAPQKQTTQAMKKINSLISAYKIEAIAIGNGTASRETEAFIKRMRFQKDVQVFIVNEAGASIYSASKIAREEFPNYDITVRGAVSIGRRLADPLAELVKIDAKSIGVGQYQHDVDQSKLKEELDETVFTCVNSVGVNINTASKSLLSYVSGIGDKLAENIVEYRKENGAFSSRNEIKKVKRLGAKAFEQSAAFLRIKNAKNPLDDSAVHPESYPIVERMAKSLKVSLNDLIGNKDLISKIKVNDFVSDKVGIPTLEDIVKELEKPGLDPRKKATIFEFDATIKTIEDLRTGQILPGIINNITNFGCFVDIGIKESGLVHISNLSNTFVSDINEVVSLHQQVKVKVLEVDLTRKRIQLSMNYK
ncbi:Tex family protein [Aureivirga sp. CE67]|uniref:Tex family protein n=1 Tax=Aureivirga sp. CE67 TaxID=1788983 RepID=UPI0018CB770E|nr:Tex family protein [Aureivirga sp. CE67]